MLGPVRSTSHALQPHTFSCIAGHRYEHPPIRSDDGYTRPALLTQPRHIQVKFCLMMIPGTNPNPKVAPMEQELNILSVSERTKAVIDNDPDFAPIRLPQESRSQSFIG
jgi:hypothetical protein